MRRSAIRISSVVVGSAAAALAVLGAAPEARAQGCVINRQTSPLLGSTLGPYLQKGEWQAGAMYRTFRADTQYRGTRVSQPISRLGNTVIPELQTLDLAGTYALNRQTNLTLNIPILIYGADNRALPAGTANAPRYVPSAKGLGDLSLTARRWLLDTSTTRDQNISLGLGVKAPTGNSNAKDSFPNATGNDIQLRAVDPAIQPGDGGWGLIMDVQAFKQVKTATLFFSGTYLMNPRGQTGTLSPRSALNPAGPSAVPDYERYNSVVDQYNARLGVSHPVPGVNGLSLMVAGRLEGVPTDDLAGTTIGFRRPGYTIAVEPGIIYATGSTVFSLTVPVVTQRNVRAQLPGVPRDSTFADYQIIAGVSHRFGRTNKQATPLAPKIRLVDLRCPKCGELHAPEVASTTPATPVPTE
jgi:hypothetical protein